MKKTRFLAWLMAAVLLLTSVPMALAEDDVVVLTVAGPNGYNADWSDLMLLDMIEEKLGIRLVCTGYSSDAWDTQLTLMMYNDELPDIIIEGGITHAEANKFGAEDMFLDLSTLMDQMPNLKAYMDEHPIYRNTLSDENGAIYGLARTRTENTRYVTTAYINTEWLKNVGMEYPTTTEEFYNVLKAFQEQDANGNGDPTDEIPLSYTHGYGAGQRMEFILRSAFGIHGHSLDLQLMVDENNKVFVGETSENYKEYLKYMNRLYKEKLIDQDIFIMTEDEFVGKTKADKVGAFASWSGLGGATGDGSADAARKFPWFGGVKSELLDEIEYCLYNPVNADHLVNVSASTKHPEAVAKLLDYAFTEEGRQIYAGNVEGVTFNYKTIVDDYKTVDRTGFWEDSGYKSVAEWERGELRFPNAFRFFSSSTAADYVTGLSDERLDEIIRTGTDYSLVFNGTREQGITRKLKLVNDYPALAYTNDEISQRSVLMTDMISYIASAEAQFIIGDLDLEKDWQSYLDTLNAMGLEQLLKLEQGAYDRYAANIK